MIWNEIKVITINFLPFVILAGAVLLLASLIIVTKIVITKTPTSNRLFWKIIAGLLSLFLISYLVSAYLIYQKSFTFIILINSFVYLIGAFFTYIILDHAFKDLLKIVMLNKDLEEKINMQNKDIERANEQAYAVARANAKMTEIYLEIEEAKIEIENKEIALRKKNEETNKINEALGDANSNITSLYIELEEMKEELIEKKEELQVKNEALSKSNVMLADIFKRFVPEQFLNKIAREGIENINTGYAERVDVTILFSDIRHFTETCELLDTHSILFIMNKYFSQMSNLIYENNGFIDKFIGDAIMSLFEDLAISTVSHATNAVNAAISMQQAVKSINQAVEQITTRTLKTGIGIHSGEVILGTVGLEKRMDSTVLGSNVNIASRIEHLTKYLDAGIIISESTLKKIDNVYKYHYRELGSMPLRGIKNKIRLFEFFDGDEDEIKVLKSNTIKYFLTGADFMDAAKWGSAMQEYEKSLIVFPEDVAAKYLLAYCKKEIKGYGLDYPHFNKPDL